MIPQDPWQDDRSENTDGENDLAPPTSASRQGPRCHQYDNSQRQILNVRLGQHG
jgi:hypothetical protein